jgi:hypothetical protein
MVVNATTPALRITQTGTGDSILVEDSSNPDSSPFVVTAAGNVGIGSTTPSSYGKLQIKQSGTAFNNGLAVTTSADDSSLFVFDSGLAWKFVAGYLSTGSYKPIVFTTSDIDRMTLDASGNLGLGVTPSAWRQSGDKAMQIGSWMSMFTDAGVTAEVASNMYVTGASYFAYSNNGYATRYRQYLGKHEWFNAPSGTAGATTSITSGLAYSVTTLGSTTLGEWQAFFSALTGIPSIGQTVTATATGTLAGGATVTQIISFTQAMTLDASRRLAVNATDPSTGGGQMLISQEQGNGLVINSASASYTPTLYLRDLNTANPGRIRFMQSNGLAFIDSADTERARITSGGDFRVKGAGTAGSTDAFQVSGSAPADAARIDSSGNLLVGTTSGYSGDKVVFEQTAASAFCQRNVALSNAGTYRYIAFVAGSGGSQVGYIESGALAKVALLKPCTYKWNADGSDGEGFIAHELAEVVPQCVTGQKDAVDAEGKPVYQGIDTSFLVATLTAAIQEQQAMINELKAEVAALKGA